MKSTVRLNFDFPRSEYPYLKLICAEKGMSLKEFATNLLLKEIEKYEDKAFSKRADSRLKEMKSKDKIPFDEAWKLIEDNRETEI